MKDGASFKSMIKNTFLDVLILEHPEITKQISSLFKSAGQMPKDLKFSKELTAKDCDMVIKLEKYDSNTPLELENS